MKAIVNKKIQTPRFAFGDEVTVREIWGTFGEGGYANVRDKDGRFYTLKLEDINLKPE